jgi:hypothetical protein
MTLARVKSLFRRRRVQVLAIVLLLPLLTIAPLHLFAPAPAAAHGPSGPVQVGISFSPQRAEYLGLDYHDAFRRLEALHFRIIRLSAYWDEIDRDGYGQLDWLMNEARRSHQPVLLTVGMKALGWPEFFIPPTVIPVNIGDGQDIATDAGLRDATLSFIADTVLRYRDNPVLYAWQIENEPFNRAGPQRLWIDAAFLKAETTRVRQLDNHHRPMIVNAFSHFNLIFDQVSARQGLDVQHLLGFDADSAERDSLSVLRRGDILGLDVYTAIGYQFLGQNHLTRADADWPDRLARVRDIARSQGKQAWITEAQAEPWEAPDGSFAKPKSISPQAIRTTFANLKDEGYGTVLFWGAEYWLWQQDHGDARWLNTVKAILRSESNAPSISLAA